MPNIEQLGVAFDREDSFKMVGGRVLGDRILIGVGISEFALERLLLVADDLGLPQDGRAELAPHESLANAVFFGVESEKDGAVCKVYQEFWDHVRHEVRRTASAAPRLLHLGVKWHTARPGRYELARYPCHAGCSRAPGTIQAPHSCMSKRARAPPAMAANS